MILLTRSTRGAENHTMIEIKDEHGAKRLVMSGVPVTGIDSTIKPDKYKTRLDLKHTSARKSLQMRITLVEIVTEWEISPASTWTYKFISLYTAQ